MGRKVAVLVAATLLLGGCGSMNSALATKKQSIEYYRIFDVKTAANRSKVASAASSGLAQNVGGISEARPIPKSSKPPEEPGRFRVVDPLEGTPLAGFAKMNSGASSLGLKKAQCDDAVWTAYGTKPVSGSMNLMFSACLFEYAQGYHLDMYANLIKEEGGLMQISRSMANAVVGTPEEWTEKAFLDVVRKVYKETNAEIKFVDGYPEMSGTPWLDSGETFGAK